MSSLCLKKAAEESSPTQVGGQATDADRDAASSYSSYTVGAGKAMEILKSILLIVSALFPIVNPLGGSPVFLALTHDYPRNVRTILARKVAINSFVLMVASFLVGTHILRFFGISIPVLQVGGGLIVIANGWAMRNPNDG